MRLDESTVANSMLALFGKDVVFFEPWSERRHRHRVDILDEQDRVRVPHRQDRRLEDLGVELELRV